MIGMLHALLTAASGPVAGRPLLVLRGRDVESSRCTLTGGESGSGSGSGVESASIRNSDARSDDMTLIKQRLGLDAFLSGKLSANNFKSLAVEHAAKDAAKASVGEERPEADADGNGDGDTLLEGGSADDVADDVVNGKGDGMQGGVDHAAVGAYWCCSFADEFEELVLQPVQRIESRRLEEERLKNRKSSPTRITSYMAI